MLNAQLRYQLLYWENENQEGKEQQRKMQQLTIYLSGKWQS